MKVLPPRDPIDSMDTDRSEELSFDLSDTTFENAQRLVKWITQALEPLILEKGFRGVQIDFKESLKPQDCLNEDTLLSLSLLSSDGDWDSLLSFPIYHAQNGELIDPEMLVEAIEAKFDELFSKLAESSTMQKAFDKLTRGICGKNKSWEERLEGYRAGCRAFEQDLAPFAHLPSQNEEGCSHSQLLIKTLASEVEKHKETLTEDVEWPLLRELLSTFIQEMNEAVLFGEREFPFFLLVIQFHEKVLSPALHILENAASSQFPKEYNRSKEKQMIAHLKKEMIELSIQGLTELKSKLQPLLEDGSSEESE